MTTEPKGFYELLSKLGEISDDLIELQMRVYELHAEFAKWRRFSHKEEVKQ